MVQAERTYGDQMLNTGQASGQKLAHNKTKDNFDRFPDIGLEILLGFGKTIPTVEWVSEWMKLVSKYQSLS